jgi:two-component system sensor histidine kinase GlrK
MIASYRESVVDLAAIVSQRLKGLSLYRPHSIARLVLLGLGATLTPLIAAVITAAVRVDGLAEDYRVAVLEAEIATQQRWSLLEQLTEMQRSLGRYRVLGEPAIYEVYLGRRETFRNAVDSLAALNLSAAVNADLMKLLEDERALFALLGGESTDMDDAVASVQWTELAVRARTVLAVMSGLIADQANAGLLTSDDLQRQLLLQAALVIPASLALAGLFVVWTKRPMHALSLAIRRLGSQDLSEPIRIRGPHDIEELGLQLEWLRQRISQLEHQKLAFLQHISHELKTPLTTLREGSELLAESLAESLPEDAEISRLMQTNSIYLQKLIEDLLQFGKTQQPLANPILRADFRMDELILGVVAAQRVAIGAKHLNVQEHLEAVTVLGDRARLSVVIDNLLSNAIKYTPTEGNIVIRVARRGGGVQIDVQDSGPGIGSDEQESIFEPFVQGRAVYKSSVRGTGLGLAIAKEYVEAHHGRIEVVRADVGAHIRVTIPTGTAGRLAVG